MGTERFMNGVRYHPGRQPGDLTLTARRHIRRTIPAGAVSVKTFAISAICLAILAVGSIGLGHAQPAPKSKAAAPAPAPAAAPATPATPPAEPAPAAPPGWA